MFFLLCHLTYAPTDYFLLHTPFGYAVSWLSNSAIDVLQMEQNLVHQYVLLRHISELPLNVL